MGNPFGFGAGFAEGIGDQFANAARMELENRLQQRAQLWNIHSALLEKSRPEAWPQILTRMGGIMSTPINKKLPKEYTDFETLFQPPPGYNQPGQPSTPSSTQFTPEAMPAQNAPPPEPPTPLFGGNGARGMSLSAPGPGLAPPEYKMNASPGAPLAGLDQLPPPPPGYSPIYSPEELTQQAAQRAAQTARATMQAQIEERENLIKNNPTMSFQQLEMTLGHQPIAEFEPSTFYYKGPNGEKMPGSIDRYTRAVYDQRGQIVPNAQAWTSADEADTVWKATLRAHGGNVDEALRAYNTTQAQRTGYTFQKQADGSVLAVPYQEGTTTTRGGGAPPEPPVSKITGPGKTVGYTVPEDVQKAFGVVNDADSRYETMQESLPKALAGDQQAMVNLLGAHIGMTVQGNSIRGTQSVWEEAANSTPWLEKALARWTHVDPDTGDVTIDIDPKAGVFLTPPQMKAMVDLGKQRVDVAEKSYNRVREERRKGYGMQQHTQTTGATGKIIVTDPKGKEHDFDTQEQADKFKKLAGIP